MESNKSAQQSGEVEARHKCAGDFLKALFVHGMGRSPLSGWPMLRRLRKAGIETSTFRYSVSSETFECIVNRLSNRIAQIPSTSPYILIGHSLGGVLIRAALNLFPQGAELPQHVFLLGSPEKPSSIAVRLKHNSIFRAMTRDCGQFLSSLPHMESIGELSVPVTAIVGVRGITSKRGPFAGEPNDGIVSVAEVSAPWITTQVQIPVVHALLPASPRTAAIIVQSTGQLLG